MAGLRGRWQKGGHVDARLDAIRRWFRPAIRERRLPDTLATLGLLGALAGAGMLTVQAYRADDARREATARGVRHLASVAAWEFARQASAELEHVPRMALWTASAATGPAVDHATHAAAHCPTCAPRLTGAVTFAATGRVGALALTEPVPSGLSPDEVLEVAQLAARKLQAGESEGAVVLTRSADARRRRVVAALARWTSASAVSVQGLVAPDGWLEQVLARAASRETLPPSLLGRAGRLDAALAVTVRTPAGEVIFRSNAPSTAGIGLTGTAALALDDSLVAEVSVAPSMAAALADFMPRARPVVPLLVFGLTAVVLVLGAMQQRRAAALARQRADFLASVSHDLNTPLALITVHAETLLKPGAVPEAERDVFTRVIVREARRLARLVDEALRFTDLERGTSSLQLRPLDVTALLREAVSDFGPLAAAQGVSLALMAEPWAPALIAADRDALRQVLFSLLDNAVKYGPWGQTVTARASRVGDAVAVTIDDEGPGIPRRDRQRVFGWFVRLRRVAQGAPAGSGIGLAVVRELCGQMGVKIALGSSPAGGTRVVLHAPRCVPDAAESEAPSSSRDATTVTD